MINMEQSYAEWNLTVSEKPEVIMFKLNQAALLSIQLSAMCQVFAALETQPGSPLVFHLDMLVSRGDPVMFTCNISEADTKLRAKAPDQIPAQDPIPLQSGGEEVPSEPQGVADRRKGRTLETQPGSPLVFHLDMLVSRGDPVMFTCNISEADMSQNQLDQQQIFIMFKLNQAALLSIQLSAMCQVFAVLETQPVYHFDMLVSRGDPVMFTCNISETNMSIIIWTNSKSVLINSVLKNQTFSNFSSHRLKIDLNLPSKLNIFSAQSDDPGLYRCTLNDKHGSKYAEWNLTVSEKPEVLETQPVYHFDMLVSRRDPVMFTCNISEANMSHRSAGPTANLKLRAKAPDQIPAQDPIPLQSGGEEVPSEPQGVADRRKGRTLETQPGSPLVFHLDMLVSRRDPVMFTCNISEADTSQIIWTNSKSVLTHSVLKNQTFSNFSSHRLKIDLNLPSKLNIFSAQSDDAGLYRCNVSDKHGTKYAEWNLTVWEKPEGG
ncbi:hypothetical protein L3Q82_017544 [Scortum barcoo]|uniref:Uncharacterized protein n=1 Tax=Scortum barcoo TaxID=214431 RepID=A0ACB8VLG8_9TELE|nr:hypothetical protein L3Q82_017544 [Scortum barcoo]